jgi:hypothetical protein
MSFYCVCGTPFPSNKPFLKHVKDKKCSDIDFFPFHIDNGVSSHYFKGQRVKIGSTVSLRLYLNEVTDPLPIFAKQKKKIAKIIELLTERNQLRAYLCSKTSMFNPAYDYDDDGDDDESYPDFNYFRSETEFFLHNDNIVSKLDDMIEQVDTCIQNFQTYGSGHTIHSTEYIALEVAFLHVSN